MNNILEQDHRYVKKRVVASQWFRSIDGARNTIAGYEACLNCALSEIAKDVDRRTHPGTCGNAKKDAGEDCEADSDCTNVLRKLMLLWFAPSVPSALPTINCWAVIVVSSDSAWVVLATLINLIRLRTEPRLKLH